MIEEEVVSNTKSTLGLALGAAVALGLARFSYALLLPEMRQDLHWNYALSGGMNTANALGYLLGALLTTSAIRVLGMRLSFVWGLGLTAAALVCSALSDMYSLLLLMRFLAGASGAVVFIVGGVFVAHTAQKTTAVQSGKLLGLYYAGVGFGILFSGVSLPFLLEMKHDWRLCWMVLGAASLLLGGVAARTAWQMPEPSITRQAHVPVSMWCLFWALLAYFCFALGYIAYMTFVVALIRHNGAGFLQVALFWAVLGTTTMIAPNVWAVPITQWKAAKGFAATLMLVTLGAILPLGSHQFGVILFSALCFGSFLSAVAATTALVRRYLPQAVWSAGITLFTVVFAAGQSLGPLVSGWLSDGVGGLQTGMAWSAGILSLSVVLALLQPARSVS